MNTNLKWLLLVPVLLVAVGLGILVPRLIADNGGDEAVVTGDSTLPAEVQTRVDELQGLVRSYEDLLQTTPSDLEVAKALGDSYYELASLQEQNNKLNDAYSSYKGAVDNYRKVLAATPDNAAARMSLGLAYYGLGMRDVAYRELRSVDTGDPVTLIELGNAFVKVNLPAEAEQTYRKVQTDDPEIIIELGLAYLEGLQRIEDAERELKRATGIAPDNQRAWLSLGYVLYNADKVDEARTALDKAIGLDPSSEMASEAQRFLDELNR